MSVAPTVAELPLQDIRFLFGTIPQIRMLPDKLKQTGTAGIGEFKLVAHFPASSGATEADKKAYLNRHAGFQGGDYGIYYDGTYSLDEINWDATNRAGVHLVTQDKYGNTVQFPVVPSKSVPGDLKLLVSEYVESILNPPLMVRCSAIGGRLTPDPNAANTFDLSVNPQQPKCPIKARPHVPQQYHAEEMTMDHGRYVVDASALTDAEIEYLDFYLYGAEGETPIITKDGTRRRGTQEMEDFQIEVQFKWKTLKAIDPKYEQELENWVDEYCQDTIEEDLEELIHKKKGKQYYDWWPDDGSDEVEVEFTYEVIKFEPTGKIDYETYEEWEYDLDAETFNSPYAGSGALSGVGLSTSQLTSTVGSGTFDEASLNSSGHMNVFANAEDEDEEEEPEYPCDICEKPAKYNFQDTTVRYEIVDDDFENPKVSDYGGQNQNDFYCEAHAKQYEGSDFHTLRSEEGNTPVQDPMEFGEMANWRPLDGTPGLKRQRAETLRDSGQRNAYATVNFEWTCQGLPDGFDNYSEIEQQVVNQIGYVTDNINMDFNRHYDTMEVEIDGVYYPCEFEYQLEFDEINYHGAENFEAQMVSCVECGQMKETDISCDGCYASCCEDCWENTASASIGKKGGWSAVDEGHRTANYCRKCEADYQESRKGTPYAAEEYEYWCSYCGDRGPKTSYPQWCKTYQNNGGAGYHSQLCGTCYDTHEGLCYYCESGDDEFAAYSDPISDRQVWKIGQLGGKVSQNMNRSQASDYIKDLMGKPSGTWKKE